MGAILQHGCYSAAWVLHRIKIRLRKFWTDVHALIKVVEKHSLQHLAGPLLNQFPGFLDTVFRRFLPSLACDISHFFTPCRFGPDLRFTEPDTWGIYHGVGFPYMTNVTEGFTDAKIVTNNGLHFT